MPYNGLRLNNGFDIAELSDDELGILLDHVSHGRMTQHPTELIQIFSEAQRRGIKPRTTGDVHDAYLTALTRSYDHVELMADAIRFQWKNLSSADHGHLLIVGDYEVRALLVHDHLDELDARTFHLVLSYAEEDLVRFAFAHGFSESTRKIFASQGVVSRGYVNLRNLTQADIEAVHACRSIGGIDPDPDILDNAIAAMQKFGFPYRRGLEREIIHRAQPTYSPIS